MGDLETFGLEGVDQGVGNRRFVFNKQDAGHGRIATDSFEMPMKKR
jgi:hypothetical protein